MAKSSKAKIEANNRYTAKAYDRLAIVVPKGRKKDIDQYAKRAGVSTNALVNALLQGELRMTDEEWKEKPPTEK